MSNAIIEALKYDERIWRAFQLLKTCHREGLIDALTAAVDVTTLRRLATAETELVEARRERDEAYKGTYEINDKCNAMRRERDAAIADLEQSRARHKMCQDSLAGAAKERDRMHEALVEARSNAARFQSSTYALEERVLAVSTERDAALSDLRAAREIDSKVNAAIGRAGIHCALHYWDAIDQIAAARDDNAARASLEAAHHAHLRTERDHARQAAKAAEERCAAIEADARRYDRLRVLGCAPGESKHLDSRTVLRFTNLDAFVDADIDGTPSRGEWRTPATKETAAQVRERLGMPPLSNESRKRNLDDNLDWIAATKEPK